MGVRKTSQVKRQRENRERKTRKTCRTAGRATEIGDNACAGDAAAAATHSTTIPLNSPKLLLADGVRKSSSAAVFF